MAKAEDTDVREMCFKIGEIKPQDGANGTYHVVTAQGAPKGFICFDKFDEGKKPKVGELWWANFKEKGKYKNFVDMIIEGDYKGPREKEGILEAKKGGDGEQPPATSSEDVTDNTQQKLSHGDYEGRRQLSIIRQSCLKTAVDSLPENSPDEAVLKRAETFEAWVLR